VPAIIDTTVWIDFFRNSKTEQTDLLEVVVRRGEAALGDVILSEILQGIDSDREFRSQSAAPIAKGMTYSGMRRSGDLHAAHYRW
jgi:predicted nucleic acid-binding protein